MRNTAAGPVVPLELGRTVYPSHAPWPAAAAPDVDRHRREVVQLFVVAREHLDHVVATLAADVPVLSTEQRRGRKHGVSDSIAAAIDSLDLAFDRWCDGVDGR